MAMLWKWQLKMPTKMSTISRYLNFSTFFYNWKIEIAFSHWIVGIQTTKCNDDDASSSSKNCHNNDTCPSKIYVWHSTSTSICRLFIFILNFLFYTEFSLGNTSMQSTIGKLWCFCDPSRFIRWILYRRYILLSTFPNWIGTLVSKKETNKI